MRWRHKPRCSDTRNFDQFQSKSGTVDVARSDPDLSLKCTSSHHEKGPGRRLAHTLWQAIRDGCHRSQSSSLRLCRNGRRIMRAHSFHLDSDADGARCNLLPPGMHAQRSFSEHNSTMASLQPAFVTPLVAPDPRLIQYARFSVSHEYTAEGAETVNYGNGKGGGIIVRQSFRIRFHSAPLHPAQQHRR